MLMKVENRVWASMMMFLGGLSKHIHLVNQEFSDEFLVYKDDELKTSPSCFALTQPISLSSRNESEECRDFESFALACTSRLHYVYLGDMMNLRFSSVTIS